MQFRSARSLYRCCCSSILAIVACLGLTAQTAIVVAADRPNVVFILADDLGYGELGCFGQKKIRTPNLDRLAAEGMRLTQHYSGAPVCAPSRCVLMTGKHLGRAEIRGNRQASKSFPEFKEGQHPISAAAFTLAEAFQAAGYATGATGKWGLGPVGSTGDPNKQGFDFFFGYNCQAVAHSYYPKFLWRNGEQIEINASPIPGHAPKLPLDSRVDGDRWLGQSYAPDLMEREAVDFIQRNKSQPFFLYCAFVEPHVAMHPPKNRIDEYPADWDSKPYHGDSGYLPHPRPRAAYATMISDLDRHVGAVMAALEKHGLQDNTLVVFSSDNGTTHAGPAGTEFHIGGCDAKFFESTAGLRGYKGSVYEGGIRVPTIVRFPGRVRAKSENATPSYFADWFPTLCAAANIPTESLRLDGENLWAVLTGRMLQIQRNPLVWVFPEYGGQVAVRMGDWKVVRQQLKTKQPGPWELYDLAKDREEQNNIAAANPEVLARAIEVLKSQVAENEIFPLTIPEVNP